MSAVEPTKKWLLRHSIMAVLLVLSLIFFIAVTWLVCTNSSDEKKVNNILTPLVFYFIFYIGASSVCLSAAAFRSDEERAFHGSAVNCIKSRKPIRPNEDCGHRKITWTMTSSDAYGEERKLIFVEER